MTFAAAGSFLFSASTTSLTMANVGAGNLLLVSVYNYTNATVTCTGLSGGGATWTQLGTTFTGTVNAMTETVFAGKVTATGAGTATATWSGATPAGEINGHEFTSTVGSWSLDVQGNLDSATNNAPWPSLTPATNGELYFGTAGFTGTVSAGSTTGYTYSLNANGDGCVFDPACTVSVATHPVWGGNTNNQFGVMVLVKEAAAAVKPSIFPGRSQAIVTAATR